MSKIPTIEPLKIAVEAIKSMMNKEHTWQKTFDEMFDGHFVPMYFSDAMDAICKLVSEIYNDKEDDSGYSMFTWWIWEAEFGNRKEFANNVTDKDKKKIPMNTVEDLYNYYKEYTLKEENND